MCVCLHNQSKKRETERREVRAVKREGVLLDHFKMLLEWHPVHASLCERSECHLDSLVRAQRRPGRGAHKICLQMNLSVQLGFSGLHTVESCDTGRWVTNVSFLGGSTCSCEPRRQEAVWVSDNHIEWTMPQIGVGELTHMPGLTGRACRNWP